MEIFILFIFWIVFSALVGVFASKKGHSAAGYFFFSLLLSPLLCFLIALLSDDKTKPNLLTHKKCPDCKELVLIDAIKCKHCGSVLEPQSAAPVKQLKAVIQKNKTSNSTVFITLIIGFLAIVGIGKGIEHKANKVQDTNNAPWVVVGENAGIGRTIYADPTTIRKNGNIVTMWGLVDFKPYLPSTGKLSHKDQYEFDCNKMQSREIFLSWYSGNMGSGEIVIIEPEDDKWLPISSSGYIVTLWNYACGKQLRTE